MKNEKIPAVIEKSFKNTVWCKEILEGIGKHNFFDIGENGKCTQINSNMFSLSNKYIHSATKVATDIPAQI